MIGTLEEYEARYNASSAEEIEAEWAKWGSDRNQRCRNKRSYDQWLDCGFKGEPVFGAWGWLYNDQLIKAQETIRLWTNGCTESTVECAQLPNGKWISGIHWHLSISGCSRGLSIWRHQYDSRIEALQKPLVDLIAYIKKHGSAKDREHIADVTKVLGEVRQLNLFD